MMDNPVNCWKAKSKDMPISSEALDGNVQRLSVKTEYVPSGMEAQDILQDEDIVRSPEKSVSSLYIIHSDDSDYFYIGITSTSIERRMAAHRNASHYKKTPLYDWMRKHDDWRCVVAYTCETREEVLSEEMFWISFARDNSWKILNLADGGEGGFVVPNKCEWRKKLSKARKGRKPAMGMKHTEDNKKLFSEVSNKYWETQETYNINEVCNYSFKEAHNKFGISKTHYYRLRRAWSNDPC